MEKQVSFDDVLQEENKKLRDTRSDTEHPFGNTGAIPICNSTLISKDISIENDKLEENIEDTDLDSNIFIDWLSCTIPVETYFDSLTGEEVSMNNPFVLEVIDKLQKLFNVSDDFKYKLEVGAKGYRDGVCFGEHIKVFYNGINTTKTLDDKDTIYLDISGSGCRELESFIGDKFSWQNFIETLMVEYHASFTRLDFSCDIFNEDYFTLEQLLSKLRKFHYTSPVSFLDHRFITEDGKKVSNSCYVGSLKSNRYLLIYDKLEERKVNYNTFHCLLNTWIRFEMRFKQDWAKRLAFDIIYSDSLPNLFKGVLYDFLDIKTKSRKSVANPSQLHTWNNWLNFLDHVSKIKLTNQNKKETNLYTKKKWFDRCVSRYLLQSYIADDDFNERIYKSIIDKIKDFKDKDLVEINSYLKSKGKDTWTYDEAIARLVHLKESIEIKNNK